MAALKGGPFRFFYNIHSFGKYQKTEGGPFEDIEIFSFHNAEVSQCRKMLKREPFSLARYCLLRGKRRKTFLDQFARPNSSL